MVSGNANAGFNVVLTGIIYVVYVGMLGAVFNKKRSVSQGVGVRRGGGETNTLVYFAEDRASDALENLRNQVREMFLNSSSLVFVCLMLQLSLPDGLDLRT